MSAVVGDIHQILRYSIPGYLFLVPLSLVILLENVQAYDFTGSVAMLIFGGFILGLVFYYCFQLIFIFTMRSNHFNYLIKRVTNGRKLSYRKARLINDIILYNNTDFKYRVDRITHSTSKFYMCGSIIFSQIVSILWLIFHSVSDGWKLEFVIPFLYSISFIVYGYKEGKYNYMVLLDYNRETLESSTDKEKVFSWVMTSCKKTPLTHK